MTLRDDFIFEIHRRWTAFLLLDPHRAPRLALSGWGRSFVRELFEQR